MNSITEKRAKMDSLNNELLEIFLGRMRLSKEIITRKAELGLPVYDALREEEIIAGMAERSGEGEKAFTERFFRQVLSLCREYAGESR